MYSPGMRTTIEIKDHHRAKLLELAARRGLKSFSQLVEEAIAGYLRQEALYLRGSLSPEDVDQLAAATRTIRKSWR